MEKIVARLEGVSVSADQAEVLLREYFAGCGEVGMWDVTVLTDVDPLTEGDVIGTLRLQVILTPKDLEPVIDGPFGVMFVTYDDEAVEADQQDSLTRDVFPWFDARGIPRPVFDGDRRWVHVAEVSLTSAA